MDEPKVSICIPAYHQPLLIKKAIESVLEQEYKDYEIIVTDDSKDDSVEKIVREYNGYNNIHYFKNEIQLGSPRNWNESIKRAQGEYIKILHHDDWFTNKYSLGSFVSLLDSNPNSDFAFSGCVNLNPQQEIKFVHRAKPNQINKITQDPNYLFIGNFIGAPSCTIFRRNINVLFDEELKWLVDIDFYIRVLSINRVFEYTRDPLISIRMQSEDQVTALCVNNKQIQIYECLKLLEKINQNKNLKGYQFRYCWRLFDRFGIVSLEGIRECGFDGYIPIEMHQIFDFLNGKLIIFAKSILTRKLRYFYIVISRICAIYGSIVLYVKQNLTAGNAV